MIGTKITRRLQSHFESQFAGLYKVTVIGSTGSGKTTLLKAIVEFQTKAIEQPRRHQVEETHDLTYTMVDRALKDQKSFTTVSFNSVKTCLIYNLPNGKDTSIFNNLTRRIQWKDYIFRIICQMANVNLIFPTFSPKI